MARVIWKFGLIAGGILAASMIIMIPLCMNGTRTFDNAEVVGYSSMLLAFIMIFLGIRSEREQRGGTITFGQAFKTGVMIALVASAVYVITWEIMYYTTFPDFAEKYSEHVLATMRAKGASAAEIQAETVKMARFKKMYVNPFFNIGMTFVEVFPIGLIIALISSAILKRRPPLTEQLA